MTRRGITALCLGLANALAFASADSLPVKVVNDFVAPIFDMEAGGIKVGELRGAQSQYLGPTMADLTDFKYTAFAPDQSVEFTVESDKATVYVYQKTAFGTGTLHAKSPDYELTGKDWHIDAGDASKQIVINDGARIVFRAQIGNVLK